MPLIRRRPLAGLAAIGAAVLIAGCGGGSDSLSAEEFRSQADDICADFERQIDALAEPTSADQVLTFLRAGLPIQEAQLDRLRALDPPDELQDDFDEAIELSERQIAAIDAAADRIEGGEDPEAVISEVSDDIESLGDQADAKARDLGLTVCGADDDEPSVTTDTTPTTSTDAVAPGGTTVEPSVYVADVQEAAGALQELGTLLQSVEGLDDLRAKLPRARAALDTFDAAIAKIDGYRLENAEIEQQRAGLARTGPPVSDVMNRFLDAAGNGDEQAVLALLPEVTSAISDFQAAATGG